MVTENFILRNDTERRRKETLLISWQRDHRHLKFRVFLIALLFLKAKRNSIKLETRILYKYFGCKSKIKYLKVCNKETEMKTWEVDTKVQNENVTQW